MTLEAVKENLHVIKLVLEQAERVAVEQNKSIELKNDARHTELLAELKCSKDKYARLQEAYDKKEEAIRQHVIDPKQYKAIVDTAIKLRHL